MNWLDKAIIRLFKWRFYTKFKNPKEYFLNVLLNLNDDYQKMYFKALNLKRQTLTKKGN